MLYFALFDQMESLLMENQTLRTGRSSILRDHMSNGLDEEGQDSEMEHFQLRQVRPNIRPSSMIEMRDPIRQLMRAVSDTLLSTAFILSLAFGLFPFAYRN